MPENLAGWTAILFPVAIAYAVLREDLLGVDAGLRRLTSYILVSALTAAAFAGAVSLTDLLLQETLGISRRAPAVLLSGLAVAALLPLRDRFQSSVDRLFFRTSVDFRRLLEEALQRLARVTDLDGIRAVIEDAVREALQPETLHLDVAPGHEPSAADDERLEDLPAGGLRVPFALDGRALARLTLGRRLSGRRYGAEERRLLRNLASQGALALAKALALEQLRELNETLEGKVQERTAELAATLTALRDTQRQMAHQEKMASLGQLVAGVAHEINNPLHFVEGNLQFLRQHVDSLCTAIVEYEKIAGEYAPALTERLAEARARLDLDWAVEDLPSLLAACAEGVERTATIVRDLRSFSRADGGRRSEIDLRTSLEATLNLLQGRLIGIEVEREYGETPTVECIEGQLDQVFMNLLANAADALGERGTIRVRTACNGPDRVIVEVEDDGPGIPPEARGRIFEPFFTTKEVGKGTGLGLALSYGIVTRHGGTLGVRSGPGRGTCFILDLPIRLPEDAPQAGSAPADRPAG